MFSCQERPESKDAFGWILTSFSVVGLVIGLSLQDILRNFFAGIGVLVERPFRTTILRTPDARLVIVPNATFMTSSVVNLTRFPTPRGTIWLIVDDREKPIGADGRAHYLIGFWSADRDAVASAAIGALRARFSQGEVHGA